MIVLPVFTVNFLLILLQLFLLLLSLKKKIPFLKVYVGEKPWQPTINTAGIFHGWEHELILRSAFVAA